MEKNSPNRAKVMYNLRKAVQRHCVRKNLEIPYHALNYPSSRTEVVFENSKAFSKQLPEYGPGYDIGENSLPGLPELRREGHLVGLSDDEGLPLS